MTAAQVVKLSSAKTINGQDLKLTVNDGTVMVNDATLEYLEASLDLHEAVEEPVEIGGSTIETYRTMMLAYARQRVFQDR